LEEATRGNPQRRKKVRPSILWKVQNGVMASIIVFHGGRKREGAER